MPRPTNLGSPWPILNALPGFDPDVPTGDPPDPVDYADDAAWEIPAVADETEYTELNGPHGTLSDGGGTLGWSNPGNAKPGVGGNAVVGSYAGNGATDYEAYLESDLGTEYLITRFRVEGDYSCTSTPAWFMQWSPDGSTGWASMPGTVIDINADITGSWLDIELTTPTDARYLRLVHDDGVHGGFRCGSTVSDWFVYGAEVVDQELVWLSALAVADGSVTTSDLALANAVTMADLVIVRGVLPVAAVLASAVLRVGLEDAGSATITLEGATESDYSDAVTLDSATITATGGYAAQDVAFSLSATTGYRYLRFVLGAAQGARVYEIDLLGLPSSLSEHVADPDDAHDASAISFDPTPTTLEATDVQGAIEELDAKIEAGVAEANAAWMPLTTVVGGEPELVWDDDDSLIPTLVPLE